MSDHTRANNSTQETPYGYCHCGCGQKTPISPKTVAAQGFVKGQPRMYMPHHSRRKPLSMLDAPKTCSMCQKEKPLSEFHKCKKSQDGHGYRCKECGRMAARKWHHANRERANTNSRNWYKNNPERLRQYRAANRERSREQHRQWIAANPEARRRYDRKYYAANRERQIEKSRLRYAANRDRANEQARAWRKANPDAAKSLKRNYKARKRNADGTHTAADIRAQYKAQKGNCYYCGEKVGGAYHVDHVIPLSRGGSNGRENIVIACPTCNMSKHDKMPHEWPEGGRLL